MGKLFQAQEKHMYKRSIPFVLALVGLISALLLIKRSQAPIPDMPTIAVPASNPYVQAVAATGIVEGVHDNVAIGGPVEGLVEKVFVKVWENVEKGQPLFRLDTRELASQIAVDEAHVQVAKAKLVRLQDQYDRLASINDPRAISTDMLKTRENDVLVAEKEVLLAEMQLVHSLNLLNRMTVVAPRSGTVIQSNLLEGEYLSLNAADPAMLLGDLTQMQIRADIDEQNAHEVIHGAHARGYPKSNPDKPLALEFVRIEPYVLPKKSLTGMSDERVDTRVLQVIYRFEPPKNFRIYVGQQVDLFIDAEDHT